MLLFLLNWTFCGFIRPFLMGCRTSISSATLFFFFTHRFAHTIRSDIFYSKLTGYGEFTIIHFDGSVLSYRFSNAFMVRSPETVASYLPFWPRLTAERLVIFPFSEMRGYCLESMKLELLKCSCINAFSNVKLCTGTDMAISPVAPLTTPVTVLLVARISSATVCRRW